MSSEFAIGKPGSAGLTTKNHIYSFGIGREHFTKVFIPGKQKFNEEENIPGPGMYTKQYMNIGTHGSRKSSLHRHAKNIDGKLLK